jgi:hypothetical protein
MDDLNKDLMKRFDRCASDRKTIEQIWDAITTFIVPYRGEMFETAMGETSIDWFRHREVFDSTAVMAHQNLSSNIHGAMTSPSFQWFLMRFRDRELNKAKATRKWLLQASEACFFALQDSNFDLEVNETYQDVCGLGTAFMALEEAQGPNNQWNGFDFTSVPLKQAYYEPDYRGRVHRFYRHLRWTADQILTRFGDSVPQNIKDLASKGDGRLLDVVWCVFPRNNRTVQLGEKMAASRRPIEARYILKDSCETLGKPTGYYEMPIFSPKWRTTSDSIWGNSPAMIALADVLTLNSSREMKLIASEKLIDPPIFAEERAIITDLDLRASSLSVVRRLEGIQAFNTQGRIDISVEEIRDLREGIRNYFFMDQLTFPNPQASPMTATEAQIRYEQLQRLMGPTMGRLQSDMLTPIVERTFRMLVREGQIEEPPIEVIESNAELDLQYMGALVRAQNTDKAAAIERWMMGLANFAQVKPEIMDVADEVAIGRGLGQDLNVPEDFMRDENGIRRIRRERARLQAQAEAGAAAEQAGRGMQAVAEGERAMQEVEQNAQQ